MLQHRMPMDKTTNQAPRALKIVAALFVLSGVLAAVEVLVLLARGHVSLNLGILCIFVGYGLLRLRPVKGSVPESRSQG